MKKFLLCLVLALLGLGIALPSLASPKVLLDGQELSFEVNPVIENGRTLVPFRAIFEALEVKVNWNQETKEVEAIKDDLQISLIIGQSLAKVNEQDILLDVAPKIIEDRTMVPLRFVSENLGAEVSWGGSKKIIYIFTKANNTKERQNIVDYMTAMATIKWTPFENMIYWNPNNNSVGFVKGKTYAGIPYTQILRETTLEQFKSFLDDSNIYQDNEEVDSYKIDLYENRNSGYYYGSDCSSAVWIAWQYAYPNLKMTTPTKSTLGVPDTEEMLTELKIDGCLSIVGEYNYNYDNTASLCQQNGKDKLYLAYNQLQIGDAIMRHTSGNIGHIGLVNSIDRINKKVTAIEQSGLSGSGCWSLDKTYSFYNLFNSSYIPITFKNE